MSDDEGGSFEQHLELMQRLMQAQAAEGGADAADLPQMLAMMRGMGGGGDGGGPRGRARQQMGRILRQISNDMDDSDQYQGLLELCNQLNMATEDTLAAIRPDVFVGPLVSCLSKEYNPELMLLAARCMTYMTDAIPATILVLSGTSAVDVLLDRLRSIVDIELAEQCITCIEKIANDAPGLVLGKGGISALICFVDFFNIAVQRRAWGTVSQMCRRFKAEHFDSVVTVLPNIQQAISHDDAKIAEHALTLLNRIIHVIYRDTEKVAQLFGDMGVAVVEIVSKGTGDAVFVAALQLLSSVVTTSPLIANSLIEVGLVQHLLNVMEAAGVAGETGSPSPFQRTQTPQQQTSPQSGVDSSPGVGMLGELPSTPPSLTPPRGTSGRDVGSGRKRPITPDMLKDVCAVLTALLPKIREGHLQFIPALLALQSSGHLSDTASGRVAATDDDDAQEEAEEDEEEDEEEGRATRDDLNDMVAEGVIVIETNQRHARCVDGRHHCDYCGTSRLKQGNWFRCNQCPDFDACLQCLVEHGEAHVAEHRSSESGDAETPPHTFTDMADVRASVTNVMTKRIVAEAAGPASPTACARLQSFQEAPYLLQRVAEALPNVVRLRLDSEHPKVQLYCAMFIMRAVHFATADDLRRVLVDAPLCEAIVVALNERDLPSQIAMVHVARQLMIKLPDVYSALLMREGVTNALLTLKASVSTADAKKFSQMPLAEACALPAGWAAILCNESAELLAMFPSLTDASRTALWDDVCMKLQTGAFISAFGLLADNIGSASTFEIMNSTLLHDLRLALQKASVPVSAVVQLVSALSASQVGDGGDGSPLSQTESLSATAGLSDFDLAAGSHASHQSSSLTKFVRLLQSAVSQMETFKPPQFTHVSGVNTQIRLTLTPHHPQKFQQELAEARSASQKSKKKGSAPTSPTSPLCATPPTEGRSAQVSIEPLARMTSVIDFIRGKLLPGSRPQPTAAPSQSAGGDTEDETEEIFPPTPSDETAASMPKRARSSPVDNSTATQAIFLRIGRYVVPNTMSMLQAMQRFVRSTSSPGDSQSLGRVDRNLPPEIRQLLLSSASAPSVVIHYSTVPFGNEMVHPDTCSERSPGQRAAKDPIRLHFPKPSEGIAGMETEGGATVLEALFEPFHNSKHFLTPALEDALSLLGVLHHAVQSWVDISSAPQASSEVHGPTTNLGEFVNAKLNNKAMRHCATLLLAGQHANTWAVALALDCNYLFSPSTRRFLFEIAFFGAARSLVRMQEYLAESGAEVAAENSRRQHRLYRQKKRVWRDRALECALEVLQRPAQGAAGNAVLEFEFYNEEGSGLGPTLEFYTLVGDALRERRLNLWRAANETPTDTHCDAAAGLYPRPLPPDHPDSATMRKYFRFIGRYIARAFLDRRIPNLRLARPLVKLLRGDDIGIDQMRLVSPSVHKVLEQLVALSQVAAGDTAAAAQAVADLCLTFVAPGSDDIELTEGGADTPVTSENAMEYVCLVSEFVLKTGVEPLVHELREGFQELVSLQSLRMLTVDELQVLIDGHTQAVTLAEFETHCHADHGFTMSSPPVRWLFEVLAEMDIGMQRRFVQFLTGSPYLPVGGLANLRPRLTVVRKTSTDQNIREVDQLPSAMTCQNYLKLPQYDTKEQLKAKLTQAVLEGGGVFLFT